jgi:hypothetical protein
MMALLIRTPDQSRPAVSVRDSDADLAATVERSGPEIKGNHTLQLPQLHETRVRSRCQHQTTFSVGIHDLQAEGYSRCVPAQMMDYVGTGDYASVQFLLAADFLPAPGLSSRIRRVRRDV